MKESKETGCTHNPLFDRHRPGGVDILIHCFERSYTNHNTHLSGHDLDRLSSGKLSCKYDHNIQLNPQ